MAHPPEPPTQPHPSSTPRVILTVAAALAMVLLGTTLLVWMTFVVVPRGAVETGRRAGKGAVEVAREGGKAAIELGTDLARRLADGLGVTPKVTVDSDVLVEQSTDLLELATVERQVRVEHLYRHTFLGSTKEIRLTGRYVAKAGFDLSRGFAIDIDTAEGEPPHIRVHLPEPELLSLEQTDVTIEEEEGIWNRIQVADREQALEALREVARRDVARSGLLDNARASIKARIQQLVLEELAPMDFDYIPLEGEETPEPAVP